MSGRFSDCHAKGCRTPAASNEVEKMRNGIGELKERTLHATLKNLLQPDQAKQEVKCCGYVADIRDENRIIEIQTGNFHSMKDKLRCYLENGYDVTIVYPVTRTKWLIWIDQSNGNLTKKRRSPKTGVPQELFYELVYLKEFLPHERLHFHICMVDTEEYRNLNGWSNDRKRGSTRAERIPVAMEDWIKLDTPQDFEKLLPESLDDTFCVKDFAAACRISETLASRGITVLTKLGVIRRIGKKGRAYVYEKTHANSEE